MAITINNLNPFYNEGGTRLLGTSAIQKDQVFSATDIISEGPIKGLPYGSASIYLDNIPAGTKKQGGIVLQSTAAEFIFDGTAEVVTNNLPEYLSGWDYLEDGRDGVKFLVIKSIFETEGASVTVTPNETYDAVEITTPTAFFGNYMLYDLHKNFAYASLNLAGIEEIWLNIMEITSTTVATGMPLAYLNRVPYGFDSDEDDYTIAAHTALEIQKIYPHNHATKPNWILLKDDSFLPGTPAATVAKSGNISDSYWYAGLSGAQPGQLQNTRQVEGFNYQFRRGVRNQPPIDDIFTGSGSTQITTSQNINLDYSDDEEYNTWPDLDGGSPHILVRGDMDLSEATAREVDEVRLVIAYPAGLVSKSAEQYYYGLAVYLIEIAVDRGDGEGFGTWDNFRVDDDYVYHLGGTESNFFIQENISLNKFKPFKDFKLRITRATRDDRGPTSSYGYDDDNTVMLNSALTSITCIIRERFSYPYTGYAEISCNAKQFKNIPKRSYECKGRLIQVPTNYITRDEAINGVANYKRTTGGSEASVDQDWDGSFRDNVYTDNPAWVFYDIITNDRYGLGTWINTSDIDKYALYRIAKYCDEMVPDEKGGTEPRFLANIYLTKATEAYKVLKDMATCFRSILFWSEGTIVPVIDQAKDPIYNFTKGNVIGGAFNYESTGSKLRSNQIAVTWNNPDNDYVPEVLLVEDKENISKTGKIIIEEAVAFGATSIGQATRYGRWKLWTAINQTEVVSFKASISGAFIGPGDIINIQDADRYDVAYSGRISSDTSKTLSTSVIPLDRTVALNAGSTYEISVLIQEPAARLAQDEATIITNLVGEDYERGDILPDSLYTDEESASNIQDEDGIIVQITWAPYTHVASREVHEANSTDTSIHIDTAVEGAFTTAPDREAIWLLRETVVASGLEREGSKKMYKILGITESSKSEFAITAVEHFNEKFDAVDKDLGKPYVDTMMDPAIIIPPVLHVTSIQLP